MPISHIETFGIVGLGRMGLGIAQRLHNAQIPVIGFDPNTTAQNNAQSRNIPTVHTLEQLAQQASIIWLMIPAGNLIDTVLDQLIPTMGKNSIIIDGGNSHYLDSQRRYQRLAEHNIAFVDCGTSGGLAGLTNGYSLMVGGDHEAFNRIKHAFDIIGAPNGVEHVGPSGAGHYVKMVHNGIEYAILQAYGEGFDVLRNGFYKNLDLKQIASVWQHGSVIRSWIVELCHDIFAHDQTLESVSGAIGENATGRWTSQEAARLNIPTKTIDASLAMRAWSRQTGGNFGTKVVAALRHAFGGHPFETITPNSNQPTNSHCDDTLIDISWPLTPEATSYKNNPNKKIAITPLSTFENNRCRDSILTLNTHAGTHIDAPSHFINNGSTIEHTNLHSVVGPCVVLDLSHVQESITNADLQAFDTLLKPESIVLLKTRNSAQKFDAPFDSNFIYLHKSGAQYLTDKKVAAVGIDYLGIERAQPDHETHTILMQANITIIEGLRLAKLTQIHYFLMCLPLALHNIEAAPARAIVRPL